MPNKYPQLMPKRSEHVVKTGSKIDHKSVKFRNLQFLNFCRGSPAKIRFSILQGSQKSTQNLSKIDAKSIANRCSKKWRKNVKQIIQYRSQFGSEIGRKLCWPTHPKNDPKMDPPGFICRPPLARWTCSPLPLDKTTGTLRLRFGNQE